MGEASDVLKLVRDTLKSLDKALGVIRHIGGHTSMHWSDLVYPCGRQAHQRRNTAMRLQKLIAHALTARQYPGSRGRIGLRSGNERP